MDSQVLELLGRNRLIDELLRTGLEVALTSFTACPIQMKAYSGCGFSIDAKYAKFPSLLLAHIWYIDAPEDEVTFAMTCPEALAVSDLMGWTKTASWGKGYYANTSPGMKLRELLEPYRMSRDSWWPKVARVVGRG